MSASMLGCTEAGAACLRLTSPVRMSTSCRTIHQGFQIEQLLVGNRSDFWANRFTEVSEHVGVDAIGLGKVTERLGEFTDLPSVDDDDGQLRRDKHLDDPGFVSARGFEDDALGLQLEQPLAQLLVSAVGVGHGEMLPAGPNGYVETGLRNVYPNRQHDVLLR